MNAGFATERVVNTEFDSRGSPYESTGLVHIAERMLARAKRIPGVESAALTEAAPVYGGRRYLSEISVQGYTPNPDENMNVWVDPVTPGFFATVGTPLRMGRDFSTNDGAAAQRVAIVNETFIHQYLRDRNPLGTTIRAVNEIRGGAAPASRSTRTRASCRWWGWPATSDSRTCGSRRRR